MDGEVWAKDKDLEIIELELHESEKWWWLREQEWEPEEYKLNQVKERHPGLNEI